MEALWSIWMFCWAHQVFWEFRRVYKMLQIRFVSSEPRSYKHFQWFEVLLLTTKTNTKWMSWKVYIFPQLRTILIDSSTLWNTMLTTHENYDYQYCSLVVFQYLDMFFQSLGERSSLSKRGSQAFVLPFGRPLGLPVYGLFFLLTDPFGLPRGFPVGT